jgi:hypothetical protein
MFQLCSNEIDFSITSSVALRKLSKCKIHDASCAKILCVLYITYHNWLVQIKNLVLIPDHLPAFIFAALLYGLLIPQ